MGTATSTVSSQFQVTIPSWVRKTLKIDRTSELVWLEMRPGEITVHAKPKLTPENQLLSLCGIIQDDSWDSLEELKKIKTQEIKKDQASI